MHSQRLSNLANNYLLFILHDKDILQFCRHVSFVCYTICSSLHTVTMVCLDCVSARSLTELPNILDGIKSCSGNQKSGSDFRPIRRKV